MKEHLHDSLDVADRKWINIEAWGKRPDSSLPAKNLAACYVGLDLGAGVDFTVQSTYEERGILSL